MARYGMVVDMRRCAGCYACVVACQLWNNQRPSTQAWSAVERREWTAEDGTPRRAYLPHACMHCTDAPCEAACPTGATYTREDGIVLVDADACISCGACVTACPFEARVLATNEGWWFDVEQPAPYEEYGVRTKAAAEKCVMCADRVDEGLEPACVVNCPGGARIFGDLDDPESPASVALAEAGELAYNVPGSSYYYIGFEGMPQEFLPTPFEPFAYKPAADAQASTPASAKAEPAASKTADASASAATDAAR